MRIKIVKLVVWLVCAAPAAMLLYRSFVSGDLGVNPVETLQHETGRPALQILLATLAVTPLRKLTGWSQLIRVRRMLGLWAFFYGVAHFSIYLVFDRFFSIPGIVEDVVLRRFILSGMVALLAMLPLALTSTKGWIRRLGGARWRKLHRLVYVAAVAGALHFIWKEKVLTLETISYFVVTTGLISYRLAAALRKRRPSRHNPDGRPPSRDGEVVRAGGRVRPVRREEAPRLDARRVELGD